MNTSNPEGFIGATIANAKSTVGQSRKAIKQSNEVIDSIERDLNELDEVRRSLKMRFDKLNTYQTTLQYLRVVQQIEYLW